MNVVCTIELQNRHIDYAKCLEFIKAIECKEKYNGNRDRMAHLTKASQGLLIQVGYAQVRFSPRYLEAPMELTDRGKGVNRQLQRKHLLNEKDRKSLLEGEDSIHYHLRIHFNAKENSKNVGNIIHLQYLAMLLKYVEPFIFEDEGTRRRITVFMVPQTGSKYPFIDENGETDYDTYDFTSQYLRLLSKRFTGVIYGWKENDGQAVVTSLEFRQSKQNTRFFPLLLIDNKKYEQIFVDSINGILSELFAIKKNQRFGEADAENPNIAMRDYIAETDIKRIRDVVAPQIKDWEYNRQEILRFLQSKGEISLIHFSLFAFMISNSKANDKKVDYSYENIWQMAQELSSGLRQIVQNALQHTQRRECFFAFYLHAREEQEERNAFYKRIADRFPETVFVPNGRDEALEIIVSDINESEDMIDNFVGNLRYEIEQQKKIQKYSTELSGHAAVIKEHEKLAIRNFFAEYKKKDPIQSWIMFRREDLIAHIGLGQFAQTANRCSAAVKVISSKESILKDERHYFYKSYADGAKNSISGQENVDETYVIPGTQFSILVPIGALKNKRNSGISQLRQRNHVAENYKSYAAFLAYKEQRIVLPLSPNRNIIAGTSNEILDARKKYELVQSWTKYWKMKFVEPLSEKKEREKNNIISKFVINFDFVKALDIDYFTDADYIEVCLRGIIGALEIFKKADTDFYLAMTNLPDGFIDTFRRICTLLGVKDFPERLQLCLQENYENIKAIKRVIMLGNDFSQAISNSYVLSLEQGVDGFDKKDCEKAVELHKFLLPHNYLYPEKEQKKDNIVGAMPFDAILCCSNNDSKCLFEKQLEKMAEGSLDEEIVGYKLNNTHMRLGSKVHIESFYEMSFLFYRTTIANRLAFMILRHLMDTFEKDGAVDILKDSILFYGYASYSKAILTSITEILQEYRIMEKSGTEDYVAFSSFQHNLMLESEETQMHFGLQDNDVLGKVDENNHLILNGNTKIVQIVPISSTLTTFGKMWNKFMSSVTKETYDRISLVASYTIFWIVDKGGDLELGLPSDIEKKYWEKVEGQKIVTKLTALEETNNSCIYFFRRSAVIWHDPLKCELCYPKYVIGEVPLVETDPTSTVPTQQIRYKTHQQDIKSVEEEFCKRFNALEDCVSYDHICRRQNHYQFYIDTQKYFYNVKSYVRKWLQGIGEDLEESAEDPMLHIIFSPEHNTNVGFAQYVNTHYFKGLAEIVSINVDKQFRSNFVCEHAALKKVIEELYQDNREIGYRPVKFYFVDDTIITGETFEKANGLLQSLIPSGVYPTNLFSKVFLLVDRLSNDTRQMYVNDAEHNFLSFLHIDVSNTRTHGDSCIGCKLEQDAEKMFKRSATRNMAHYWSEKMRDYQKKAYDNRSKIALIDKKKSFRMLLFSHVMQNIMIKQERYGQLGDAYDAVMNVSCWLLSDEDSDQGTAYGFEKLLAHNRGFDGICSLFKTICRPFLSYDFMMKRQFFNLFILLAELLMGAKEDKIVPADLEKDGYVSYLFDKEGRRVANAQKLVSLIKMELDRQKISRLEFLRRYVLECLTDMGSNYVMRKQTLKKAYLFVKNEENHFRLEEQKVFWNSYEVNLHRLVSGNVDETKELWLEYLYMTGMEYREFAKRCSINADKNYVPKFLYTEITGNIDVDREENKYFYQFCCNVFLQNIGINFDILEEKTLEISETVIGKDKFYKEYWHQIYCLDQFENPFAERQGRDVYDMNKEESLFRFLQSPKKQADNLKMKSVKDWYQKLLTLIASVIQSKYHVEDINIALLTETMNEDKDLADIQLMDIVEEKLTSCKIGISETRYCIKRRVVDALNTNILFDLENNGYYINDDAEERGIPRPYVIAFFDRPRLRGVEEKADLGQNIARVFLYISVAQQGSGSKIQFILKLILREVMTYRNRILRYLQKDFAGDLYARYARKNGEQNILSHEKANSHNTTADDLITLEIFQNSENFEKNYKKIKMQDAKDWLLLRNYTNGQIAKIFNRSFNDSHEDGGKGKDSPMLYIPSDIHDSKKNPFKCALKYFSDLNLKNKILHGSDRRIALLNEIIEIQYEESLENVAFIQGEEKQYYNLEYFRCILIDMMISAIKFESTRPDYLLRIDRLFEIKDNQKICKSSEASETVENHELIQWYERLELERCKVKIYREESVFEGVDYLVVRNSINDIYHRMDDCEGLNESIRHRLHDPLDFADGHMSLLAIKRYIENLDINEKRECEFRYVCEETADGEKKYFFENRLPVLKKENENERTILD